MVTLLHGACPCLTVLPVESCSEQLPTLPTMAPASSVKTLFGGHQAGVLRSAPASCDSGGRHGGLEA